MAKLSKEEQERIERMERINEIVENSSILKDIINFSWTIGKNSVKYTYLAIKKVYLSKQKRLKDKIFTVLISLTALGEATAIILACNNKIELYSNLLYFLSPLAYLPVINLFYDEDAAQKDEEIEFNPNDDFIELYEDLKLKNDYELGLRYPYLFDVMETGKLTIFSFYKNKNDINVFLKNRHLLEEFLRMDVLEVKIEKNKEVFKIVACDEPIEEFYKLTVDLIPKQTEGLLIGKAIEGDVLMQWEKCPHLFVAGETNGGKTVAIKNIIIQLLLQSIEGDPVAIYMADFKFAIDYMCFRNIFEVIEDRKRLADFTDQLISEMERRAKLFKASGTENITEYNKQSPEKLHRIIFFCDELVECLIGKASEEKYVSKTADNLETLARLARALGIHLVLGTQLPTVKDISSSQLKSNIPGRLCGKFADESASRVVLNSNIATQLPDIQGRMIFKRGANFLEIQTPLCNSKMVESFLNKYKDKIRLVDSLKEVKKVKEEVKTLSEMKKEKAEKIKLEKENINKETKK